MRKFLLSALLFASLFPETGAVEYSASRVNAVLSLKTPGNPARDYPLTLNRLENNRFDYQLSASGEMPALVYQQVESEGDRHRVTVFLVALDDLYFNYQQTLNTGFRHDDCLFYMPGFWYRKNLRSPKEAPSFHTSDSWVVREDRLSSPMTAVFDPVCQKSVSVYRILDGASCDALATHTAGEVILSGKTSVGYTGFENRNGESCLSFGFPYREAPRTYIRKLTLAPSVESFQHLAKGETCTFSWEIAEEACADYSQCVATAWEQCYDLYRPQPVCTPYTTDTMKAVLSNFFTESFVDNQALKYYSGVELETATCRPNGVAEVGFVGRTLLNAFNALEYGEQTGHSEMAAHARAVFDSYLANGFSEAGFLKEVVKFDRGQVEPQNSIRRQSEGVYALLYYLNYEKRQGRKHPEWEARIRKMLDAFLSLQNEDGSFPRKFRDDFTRVDPTGGSTPSATLPLAMGYAYFKDKRYLEAARRSVSYLENELISKADYFSSTLDANCEDKEASLYACTAAYYLLLATNDKKERLRYAELAKKAAYFALSWYYTWDVPFAPGQMHGDIGLKTRGWGNVSVENNHIDVYVFDFVDVLHWLAGTWHEDRFSAFADVISSSMRQLLPYPGHLCGIAKTGFYPEVVQHTNWDYGKNGKGYYNDIFAPGWTVASLWELFSPGRAERFFGSLR